MEIKDKPPVGGLEKTTDSLSKQQLNSFLIDYFNYLTLALAFIILAAGLLFFVYPQYQRMAEGDETARKNLRTEYETKYNYLGAISDLKNSYRLISDMDRKKIEDMAPVENEFTGLIPEIESIVLKNGAVLNSIKIEADTRSQSDIKTGAGSGGKQEQPVGIFEQLPAGVSQAKMEISLSSVNYQVLKNLLKTFENNLRLLDIAKVNYDVQGNGATFTIYSYSFQTSASAIKNNQGIDLTIFSSEKFKELKKDILISQESSGLGKRDLFKPN